MQPTNFLRFSFIYLFLYFSIIFLKLNFLFYQNWLNEYPPFTIAASAPVTTKIVLFSPSSYNWTERKKKKCLHADCSSLPIRQNSFHTFTALHFLFFAAGDKKRRARTHSPIKGANGPDDMCSAYEWWTGPTTIS